MLKSTWRASTDVALIKYWGKKDEALRIPENNSLSIVLDGLDTVTTVEFSQDYDADVVIIGGTKDQLETQRVSNHLDRIRQLAKTDLRAKVVSENTFPKSTGLSSSGSGFAAVTCAAVGALSLDLNSKQMSQLARLASGTACRCICGGFVEWYAGDSHETSYSETIFPQDHWQLSDVIAIVSRDKKRVSSTKGHQSAQSSPFFQARQAHMAQKTDAIRQTIANRDFTQFGTILEAEALEFHSILLTMENPLIAWHPATVEVMLAVQDMRRNNIEAYFTINTGFNIHIITLPEHADAVHRAIASMDSVEDTLQVSVGGAPASLSEHLF